LADSVVEHPVLAFIGTYTDPIRFGTGEIVQGKGEGIYVCRLDPVSGTLEALGLTRGVSNPSYLAFDASRRRLYAVNELKTFDGVPSGTVSAFAVDAATGGLAFLNRQLTHGTDPCHVTVDARRRHVFVANFMGGSVCVLPVREDGSLSEASDFERTRLDGGRPGLRRRGGKLRASAKRCDAAAGFRGREHVRRHSGFALGATSLCVEPGA
jgi:6-phosphogluconolactonase (cycloisomerase 2 family)